MARSKSAGTKPKPDRPSDLLSKTLPPVTDRDPVVGAPIYAFRVGSWVESDFDKLLQPLGVTLMQFNVLRVLYRDPTNAGVPTGSLASSLITRVPDLPRMIDRLVKNGLVERLPSTTDRRVVLVRLTPKGTALIDGVMGDIYDHCKAMVAHLSTAETVQLHTLLKKLWDGFPRDQG